MRSHGASANAAYYSEPAATDYIHQTYHAVRRRLAANFVATAIAQSASAGHMVLLELGAVENRLVADASIPDASRYLTMDLACADGLADHVVADLEAGIPVRAGSIDVLVTCELIEHLYDTEGFLAECARVIRPGGHLVVTTPNLAALQDRLAFLTGRSPRQVAPFHPYLRFHIRPFTYSSLRGAVTASGFTVTAVRSNFVVWRLRSGHAFRIRVLARLLPSLGGSLILHARRNQP